MKPDINNLLKQAQKMQMQMQEAQQQLANMLVKGESGGGLVWVEMTGRHDVKRVFIDRSLLQMEEEGEDGGEKGAAGSNASSKFETTKEMLEDLIAAAINDAVRKIEKTSREKLQTLTAGMQLPAGFGGIAEE